MVDPFEKERALRDFQGSIAVRLWRHFRAWPPLIGLIVLAYLGYVLGGAHSPAIESGTAPARVYAATNIFRDDRGIPHIRARNAHDAFFGEGYAQASDRLFQMDLFRRYIYGQLSEVLGPIQLRNDETMRTLDAHDIVERQWLQLSKSDRSALQAFSDGVNAAILAQPLPLEFRLLLYEPRLWTPRDSLAITLAMAVSLEDPMENVVRRDAVWRSGPRAQYDRALPLSDAEYDVSATGVRSGLQRKSSWIATITGAKPSQVSFGSNAWGAGALRTTAGRALIANDPHLSVSVPSIWYIVELRAPHLHVAGATVPGVPGVILGHNDRIAWATTNAMVTTFSLFHPGKLDARNWRSERFHVRFSRDVVKSYYRARNEFGAPAETRERMVLVRWPPYAYARSALSTILELDSSPNLDSALAGLRKYDGPPQNFVIADADGRVSYHLAGRIANDPAWGRYIHTSAVLKERFPIISFDALPAVAGTRTAVVLSANNKMYDADYPYRLSAMFAPPYRAFRIAELLQARSRYDTGYFARMQLDAFSPADAEFAHRLATYGRTHRGWISENWVARLSEWDGVFSPGSTTASLEHQLRVDADDAGASPYSAFDAMREKTPPEQFIDALQSATVELPRGSQPWGRAGAVQLLHPFGPIGFPFLNAGAVPGDGDEYTIHVQSPALAQSFRAVWEAGAWENGGISIPTGESGEPASPHYDDLRTSWIRGELHPLPFSDAAVARSSRECLVLLPP